MLAHKGNKGKSLQKDYWPKPITHPIYSSIFRPAVVIFTTLLAWRLHVSCCKYNNLLLTTLIKLSVILIRYLGIVWLEAYVVFELVNPFQNKPWFLHVCSTSLLKTVGKGEIARNEQFLLFQQCFLPLWRTFFHFRQIYNCRLRTLSVWKSLIFVVWERVKLLK